MLIVSLFAAFCAPNAPEISIQCERWMSECVIQQMLFGEHEIENATEVCVELLPEMLWPESGKRGLLRGL